ncbi:AAEL014731-PA [Aedes aegypti]|uniref:AAEL014731-PA n=1 Tax=Aedes aegypti TaxID=7159 RepID=Q16FK3_AEDAE|nr:AAEL014731-PA [Aedes aegypti]
MGLAFAIGILWLFPPVLLQQQKTPEIIFQRIEQTSGFDILTSNLRVTKFNRTCAVLNGTVDLLVDLDNSYTFQGNLAYSRLGNNQFNMSPMKVPEDPMCDFLNDTYREYQDVFEEKTNHPFIEPEGLCPFPAGLYWYKNLVVDGSSCRTILRKDTIGLQF